MSALDAIKKRRNVDPGAIERLSQNIQAVTVEALGGQPEAPEPVPAPPAAQAPVQVAPAAPPALRPQAVKPAMGEGAPAKIDMRTLRRTGRTFPVNTKIRPEAGAQLTELAKSSGRSLAEVIEELVAKASR